MNSACKACGAPASGETPSCEFCGASIAFALSGLGLLRAGKPTLDRIFMQYKEKLEKNPKDADAHFGIAAYFAKRELYKEAAEHLRKAEKITPISGEIQYLLALVYAQWRGWTSAMVKKHSERAKKLQPKMIEASSLLYIHNGIQAARTARSKADLQKPLNLFEKARLLGIKDHLRHIYFFSAETLERAGRHDDALAMYRAARDFGMKDKAKVYVRLAMILKNQGKLKLALKNLEQAHNKEPDNTAIGRLISSIKPQTS